MPFSIGARLGSYEILAPLGAGGMGEVYRARDPRLGRDVAIKVLADRLSKDPQAIARFEREPKSVAALSHPNILAIYDVGSDQGVAYAVTELLEGESLRSGYGEEQFRGARPPKSVQQLRRGCPLRIPRASSTGILSRTTSLLR